ncbi:MAG: leucine-rich repeat domain-containing protein [Helicobacteraceae bacterium]|nr:leucine-rich repeat domain-containing protein [Helicobacteraceae bacterium]
MRRSRETFLGIAFIAITIPNSVKTIGKYAFEKCGNLRSATLSRRTNLGKNALLEHTRITYSD